jgi:uncharacterized SAM-binding protein YcdF (DUF218 family)
MAYDAVFVLGGGIVKSGSSFGPTTYADSDPFGMLGGEIRIHAAVEICEQYPGVPFIFTTGVTAKTIAMYGPEVPSEALVYSRVFSEELNLRGLRLPHIALEEISQNTEGNIREALALTEKHAWRRLAVITSAYHVARVEALFALLLQSTSPSVKLLSAEAIVQAARPGAYDAIIADAYHTSEARQRIENEEKGVKALRAGTYATGEFQLR